VSARPTSGAIPEQQLHHPSTERNRTEMSENKPEGHVVKCGTCKGSGRNPLLPLTKACGVCRGVGSVLLK